MKTTSYKKRLGITIKLYKNRKVVYCATKHVKSRIIDFLQGDTAPEWDKGYVKVLYNRKEDYYNHGYFKNMAELNKLLTEITQWDLIKLFVG